MNCRTVIENIEKNLDSGLSCPENGDVAVHLEACPQCRRYAKQSVGLRRALQAMPRRQVPANLAVSLDVLASRESARRRARVNLKTLASHWAGYLRLWADNLMRPFAIPFAGGLVSAVFLFTMLVPTFAVYDRTASDEVPTGLATEASLKSALSLGLSDFDVVVDVLIDENGSVVDYSFPRGQRLLSDPAIRRSVEYTLLCTKFTPATLFGQPASGRTRITLRRDHVDVRG